MDYLKFRYCPKWPIGSHIYYQITPYLTESHQVSLNLIESHRILSNPAQSHHISQNLTIYVSHQLSLNLTKCTKSHWISPYNVAHQISPYLTESHSISLNLTKYHQISLNLTKSHQISPKLNVRVGLHVGQYYRGDMCFKKATTLLYLLPWFRMGSVTPSIWRWWSYFLCLLIMNQFFVPFKRQVEF